MGRQQNVFFRDTSFLPASIERLQRLPPKSRVMLRPHPKRPTVRSEYDHMMQAMRNGHEYLRARYMGEKMEVQMAFYEAQGWNTAARLWSGGLWLIENNAAIRECWNSWWDHIIQFSIQDQLSLPIVLESHGLDPQEFPFRHSGDSYFERIPHSKDI